MPLESLVCVKEMKWPFHCHFLANFSPIQYELILSVAIILPLQFCQFNSLSSDIVAPLDFHSCDQVCVIGVKNHS